MTPPPCGLQSALVWRLRLRVQRFVFTPACTLRSTKVSCLSRPWLGSFGLGPCGVRVAHDGGQLRSTGTGRQARAPAADRLASTLDSAPDSLAPGPACAQLFRSMRGAARPRTHTSCAWAACAEAAGRPRSRSPTPCYCPVSLDEAEVIEAPFSRSKTALMFRLLLLGTAGLLGLLVLLLGSALHAAPPRLPPHDDGRRLAEVVHRTPQAQGLSAAAAQPPAAAAVPEAVPVAAPEAVPVAAAADGLDPAPTPAAAAAAAAAVPLATVAATTSLAAAPAAVGAPAASLAATVPVADGLALVAGAPPTAATVLVPVADGLLAPAPMAAPAAVVQPAVQPGVHPTLAGAQEPVLVVPPQEPALVVPSLDMPAAKRDAVAELTAGLAPSPASSSSLPMGSYAQSCEACVFDNPVLRCARCESGARGCRNGDFSSCGGGDEVRVDLTGCSGGIVENDHGRLVCAHASSSAAASSGLGIPASASGGGGGHTMGSDLTFSQNFQDTWVVRLAAANGWVGKPGYFLDLGAFNGIYCSNSKLLEDILGWDGA